MSRWCTIIGAAPAEDENVIALRAKIRALVAKRYAGSFRALFDHYAASGNPDRAALTSLLEDADVGNFFTRGMWADGVMKRVDTNHDGRISWEEFASIVGLPEVINVTLDIGTPKPPTPAPSSPGHEALTAAMNAQANAVRTPAIPQPIYTPPPAPAVYPAPPEKNGTFYAMAGLALVGVFGAVTFLREAGTR